MGVEPIAFSVLSGGGLPLPTSAWCRERESNSQHVWSLAALVCHCLPRQKQSRRSCSWDRRLAFSLCDHQGIYVISHRTLSHGPAVKQDNEYRLNLLDRRCIIVNLKSTIGRKAGQGKEKENRPSWLSPVVPKGGRSPSIRSESILYRDWLEGQSGS